MLYMVAGGTSVYFMTSTLVKSANRAHIFGAPISAHFGTSKAQLALVGSSVADVKVVIISMTIVYVVTAFITQRQMLLKNSAPDNPMVQQQKMMMYVMPFMMAIFCFIAPLGVLIYLLTTNFWTMGQQFFVIHNSPLPGSKAHEAHLARKAAKEAKKSGGDVATAQGSIAAGVGGRTQEKVEDAQPKPQRNQPTRTTKSQRKK
jgi:YidC/Oxa1 family membrane protein insertase